MIYICGNDLNLIDRYNSSFKNYTYEVVQDMSEIFSKIKSNDIVIISNINLDLDSNIQMIEDCVNTQSKIIVLDSVPTYEKGKKLISLGIRAYANMMINNIHLNDVIDNVMADNIWLYPEFINILVSNMALNVKTKNIDKDFEILTDREKEVAFLVLEKIPYSEISEKLNISIRTVKAHTKHIYEKFNVTNRLSFILKFS